MTNLCLYGIKDDKTGVVSMFITSQSDELAIQFYTKELSNIFKSLKKNDKVKFLNSVHNSKLVRLAEIDCAKPSVTQNLAFIADFNDLIVNDTKNEKKEN